MPVSKVRVKGKKAILSRMVKGTGRLPGADTAEFIMALRFAPADVRRMHKLSQMAQLGDLSPAERREIDEYETVGHLISLLKAKLRQAGGATNGRGKHS